MHAWGASEDTDLAQSVQHQSLGLEQAGWEVRATQQAGEPAQPRYFIVMQARCAVEAADESVPIDQGVMPSLSGTQVPFARFKSTRENAKCQPEPTRRQYLPWLLPGEDGTPQNARRPRGLAPATLESRWHPTPWRLPGPRQGW